MDKNTTQNTASPSSPGNLQEALKLGVNRGLDINASRREQRKKVARRVKALRMEQGISQEKFADLINANFLTYKGYENCKSDIPLFYLVRIADVLNTTLDYLAGRTDAKNSASIEDRLKMLEDRLKDL